MADPANDFIRDYQALAQQSWDAWTRQLQQQQPPAANPFFTPPSAAASGNETLERTLAGLKGYLDWMQGAAAMGGNPGAAGDWRQQLQQMFGGASQPFAQAFGGIDGAGAEGFQRQWQSWMQAAQQGSFGSFPGAQASAPAFGLNREQQQQQQAMAAAVMESLQASARYQSLIQRANAQGMERLQDKLTQHAEPGRQIDSLKALYDLWVDAAEEAYAEIALSDEFRQVYGEMVNAQMRVRHMQQQQTEQWCQQLGMPTRSEVSALGERLQALRREFRTSQSTPPEDQADGIMALRRELAALKRQLASAAPAARAPVKAAAVAKKRPATRSATSAPRRTAAGKAAVRPVGKSAGKAGATGAATSRASSRKRK